MIKIILQSEENQISEQILSDMKKAAEFALREEGVNLAKRDVEVSLSFVDEDEIAKLNRDYRNIDKPTDVLSFPQFEGIQEIDEAKENLAGIPIELGDVVICKEIANKQAKEYGHSEERELVYLFTHSVLHLLGYDHIKDEDKDKMRAKEEEIMKEINLER